MRCVRVLNRSTEWLNIGEKIRQELGVVLEEDGEFWSVPFSVFFITFMSFFIWPESYRLDFRIVNGSN